MPVSYLPIYVKPVREPRAPHRAVNNRTFPSSYASKNQIHIMHFFFNQNTTFDFIPCKSLTVLLFPSCWLQCNQKGNAKSIIFCNCAFQRKPVMEKYNVFSWNLEVIEIWNSSWYTIHKPKICFCRIHIHTQKGAFVSIQKTSERTVPYSISMVSDPKTLISDIENHKFHCR